MRRIRTSAIIALTAAIILTISASGAAAAGGRLVGTWRGSMIPSSGSHAPRHRLTVVVYRGERTGTWRVNQRCRGTLRLQSISNGYHHFTEVAAPGTSCAGGGVDCLKRVGAQVFDLFTSRPGTAAGTSGRLRRVG